MSLLKSSSAPLRIFALNITKTSKKTTKKQTSFCEGTLQANVMVLNKLND